jgi:hypothetical protein
VEVQEVVQQPAMPILQEEPILAVEVVVPVGTMRHKLEKMADQE